MSRRFEGLGEFEAAARHLSFADAAEELGLDRSVLGRRIRRLEERLGARLLHRTTRTVALTEAGLDYLGSVRSILGAADEAARRVGGHVQHPTGTLRVALPSLYGQRCIAPLVPDFMQAYPMLRVHLSFSDHMSDLVTERMDCAVRIGALEAGGDLIQKRLTTNRRILCASPHYVQTSGEPRSPHDLARHRLLHFEPLLGRRSWELSAEVGDTVQVPVDPWFSADNAEALRLAAVAGQGIALLAAFVTGDDLKAGRLVRVLKDWTPRSSDVCFVYPNAPFLPARVKAFRDFLAERVTGVEDAA